ncbi:MAG TPA: DUF2207 domain-containing protein [Anaerolineales bacterium]
MTRKLLLPILLVLFCLFFAANPARAAKSYYAEYFNVQIELQEGGSALVTETVRFHFEGDPFTYAFREISLTETDGVKFLDASMDGVQMSRGTQPGQVQIEEGNPLKVTWHFPPTSNAAHEFVVRYQAEGVIRKGDGDTLIWRAIPEEHDYSIDRSTITLIYPAQASVLGQPTLDWNFDAAWEANRLILTAAAIGADQDLILSARFAPDSLTSVTPRWQIQKEQAQAATARALPAGLLAGIVTLLLGGLGLFTYSRADRRDLNISPVAYTANPPSDVSPAVVGKLTKQQHSFMGAIFDLAQRGALEVREEKGFWGAKSYMLVRTDRPVTLKPFERTLIDAIFKSGETQVNMNEAGSRLAAQNNLFEDALEQELIQRGWLDPDRLRKRTGLFKAGLFAIFLAIGVFLAVVLSGSGWSQNLDLAVLFGAVAGTGLGIFILAIALLIYAGSYSALTPGGEEQSARWKGFADYLKQVSKGREPAIRPDYFERYLAYAAVFGLGANWAKYFQNLGGVPLPGWFYALSGSRGDFGAMVAVMSSSDSSGASAGGGAGASGGGSSGAG